MIIKKKKKSAPPSHGAPQALISGKLASAVATLLSRTGSNSPQPAASSGEK